MKTLNYKIDGGKKIIYVIIIIFHSQIPLPLQFNFPFIPLLLLTVFSTILTPLRSKFCKIGL